MKGTNPKYTDFISELLQLLKCFGFVTGYKSAVLPKPGCVEVTVSVLEQGVQFGTGAADVGRAATHVCVPWGCAGDSHAHSCGSFCWAVGIHTDGFSSKLLQIRNGNNVL